MLDTGCWMLDTGCWMLDTGCWMLDTGCWILDAGCWMLVKVDRNYGHVVNGVSMNKGYRDLDVYSLAHDLGVDIHGFSLKLPKYEIYEIGSQLRRSSKSISANIVEGYGRKRYNAEFSKFLVYALASCDETSEWIRYVKDCHPALSEQADHMLISIDTLGRKLHSFMQSVEANHIR